MLFKNNGNPSSILLRLGEGCVTNCYNCYSRYDKSYFYDYKLFGSSIDFIGKKCDNSFSIFLFGTNVIFHNEIEKFLKDDILSKFRLSLHISPLFFKENTSKIYYLSQKYSDIFFETCYMLKTREEFISVFKMISFLSESKINSSMDLFIDFSKYLDLVLKFFKNKNFKMRVQNDTSHLNYNKCFEFISKDKKVAIMIYNQKIQEIRNKSITNVPDNGCVVRKTFELSNELIKINEEIEIKYDGVIKMHINTYCNKAIQNISNIFKSNLEIINDFKKLDKYLIKYDKENMGKNCFDCVSSPYINNGK